LDIITLHRKGLRQRAISRKLGISRNTVKKYIENPELAFESLQPRNRKSLLDPFSDNIKFWIEEDSEYTATWRAGISSPGGLRRVPDITA